MEAIAKECISEFRGGVAKIHRAGNAIIASATMRIKTYLLEKDKHIAVAAV
jgi:hypothetical protein